MRISTSDTLLERMLQQNQIKTPFTGSQAVSLKEKNLMGMVQNVEDEKTGVVSVSEDKDILVERIQKLAEQSISSTLLTLEEMKTLAVLATDKSLSNDDRVELQKKMAELQFRLHEDTSSLGLSLIGKSYEDISPMKYLGEGFMNSQDFDTESLLKLADDCGMFDRLHQDAAIYKWERDGGDFLITSYTRSSRGSKKRI